MALLTCPDCDRKYTVLGSANAAAPVRCLGCEKTQRKMARAAENKMAPVATNKMAGGVRGP